MKRKIILLLIIIDIIWAIAAVVYDYPELIARPVYLWPILVVCPLYPALLAYIWWMIDVRKKINSYFFALGVLGSTYFGISALVFYPLAMREEGFNWLTLGAIFWVLFYGTQGLYLFWTQKYRLAIVPVLLTAIYLATKLYLDWRYNTFGYFVDDNWQSSTINLMAGFQLLALASLTTFALYGTKADATQQNYSAK